MSYKETFIEKDIASVNYNKDINEQTDSLLKKRALLKANDKIHGFNKKTTSYFSFVTR